MVQTRIRFLWVQTRQKHLAKVLLYLLYPPVCTFALPDRQYLLVKDLFKKKESIHILALIIITSDHGESLTEHEIFFDHHGLYEVTTQVPLILHNPNLFPRPKRIKGMIQHVDLVPTLRDYLGINSEDPGFDGTSMRPLIDGEEENIRKFAFFEESYVQRKIGWRNETHKYIYAPDGIGMCNYCQKVHAGVEELYDLKKDPQEMDNLVSGNRMMADQLKTELESLIQKLDFKKKQLLENKNVTKIDLEELQDLANKKKIKKKLRSLGYMD